VERLVPAEDADKLDVVVATNVLVYYSVFEQSLALANLALMLRPGGVLLSNNVLVELLTTPLHAVGHSTTSYPARPDDRDDIIWYLRQ
jgi:predicted TPR repeat methyltransferase